MEYTIDVSDVSSIEELHELMSYEMDFPDYYGGNLDALYDVVSEMTGDNGLTISFEGIPELQRNLGNYCDRFLDVLSDAGAIVKY